MWPNNTKLKDLAKAYLFRVFFVMFIFRHSVVSVHCSRHLDLTRAVGNEEKTETETQKSWDSVVWAFD